MSNTDWQAIAARWRKLSPEQKRQIRLSSIPRRVARSMAFEGEPVDEKMLQAELQRLIEQRGKCQPPYPD
jgi:hypothetical protein